MLPPDVNPDGLFCAKPGCSKAAWIFVGLRNYNEVMPPPERCTVTNELCRKS